MELWSPLNYGKVSILAVDGTDGKMGVAVPKYEGELTDVFQARVRRLAVSMKASGKYISVPISPRVPVAGVINLETGDVTFT